MARRKDVLELLRLYEGENPREAFKPTPCVVKGDKENRLTLYEADGVTPRLLADQPRSILVGLFGV